jgi:hypothetical protein
MLVFLLLGSRWWQGSRCMEGQKLVWEELVDSARSKCQIDVGKVKGSFSHRSCTDTKVSPCPLLSFEPNDLAFG